MEKTVGEDKNSDNISSYRKKKKKIFSPRPVKELKEITEKNLSKNRTSTTTKSRARQSLGEEKKSILEDLWSTKVQLISQRKKMP